MVSPPLASQITTLLQFFIIFQKKPVNLLRLVNPVNFKCVSNTTITVSVKVFFEYGWPSSGYIILIFLNYGQVCILLLQCVRIYFCCPQSLSPSFLKNLLWEPEYFFSPLGYPCFSLCTIEQTTRTMPSSFRAENIDIQKLPKIKKKHAALIG